MKGKNLFLIFSILVFFVMFYFLSFPVEPIKSVYTKVSVITRETSSEAIVNLQQGLEQAANDMDVEMSLVTLSERNNAQEQQKLIEREINSGAEAIIITPVEEKELKNTIETAIETTPIIYMGSTIQDTVVSDVVLGQDEEMGKELGRKIFVKGIFNKKILLLESSPNCEAINKRKMALLSMLEKRAKAMIRQEFHTNVDLEQKIQQIEPDIIIALEPTVLDVVAETVQRLQKDNIMVYGFGMTTKTPSYIEKEDITAAMIQNDFNLGYLSMYAAIETLYKIEKKEEGKIDYAFVNRHNMYTKENQRKLFPFVR